MITDIFYIKEHGLKVDASYAEVLKGHPYSLQPYFYLEMGVINKEPTVSMYLTPSIIDELIEQLTNAKKELQNNG